MLCFRRFSLAVAATLLAAAAGHADDYPARPVRIIVGFAPGSSVDLPARLLAQRFTEELGGAFIVENRGGAGGNLAAESVARSAKDGYTLLLATNSIANAAAMKASYDPIKDFAPIVAIATGPQMLVARPDLKANNLTELIALAKANPGKITYGGGAGLTMTGLAGVLAEQYGED